MNKRDYNYIQILSFMPYFVVLENTALNSLGTSPTACRLVNPIKAGAWLLIVKENEFRISLLGEAMLKVYWVLLRKIQNPKTERQ